MVVAAGSTLHDQISPANASGVNQAQVRCGLTVTPPWDYIAQGGTATFDVNVFCSAGNPSVELIYSPPTLGFTVSFSVNNQPAPYSSTMTVKVDASKPQGNYTLAIWSHPIGVPFPGPLNAFQNVFAIVVPKPSATALPQTDWELTGAFAVPNNPAPGTTVTFGATLRVLSTTTAFPQTVRIEVMGQVIMATLGVTYNGPVGSSMTVTTAKTLNVPAGTYTVYLSADGPPPFQYNDPNRANNGASVTFTVGTAPVTQAITTTSTSYSLTAWSLTSTTTQEVTQPVTVVTTQSITVETTQTLPGFLGIENLSFGPYNAVVVLLLAAIVAGVLVVAWKWSHPKAIGGVRRGLNWLNPQPEPPRPAEGILFCKKCHARLSVGQKFCTDCGTSLK